MALCNQQHFDGTSSWAGILNHHTLTNQKKGPTPNDGWSCYNLRVGSMQNFRASPDCVIAKIELQVLPHQNQERSILKCLPAQGGNFIYRDIYVYIYI